MDELSFNFEQFRVSAVDKVKKIDKKLNCRHGFYKREEICEDTSTKPLKTEHKNYNNDQQPQQNLPVRQILKEFEVQRQAKVKNSVQARISDLQTFSNKQIANKKQAWLKMQQAFITDMHQKESSIFQALNECEKNNVRMRSKLVQHYQELADRRKNHEIELEAREKQMQHLSYIVDSIRKLQMEFRLIYEELITLIKTCPNSDELKNVLKDDLKVLKSLSNSVDEIISKCKNGRVSESDKQAAINILSQIKNLKPKIVKVVEDITKRETKTPLMKDPSQISNSNDIIQNQGKRKDELDKLEKPIEIIGNSNVMKYISSITNLKLYTEALDFLETNVLNFNNLNKDTTLKSFIFDCKKAINIPVNSISGVNSEHIVDKYNKLYQLLSGQNVIISGKVINANRHPQGIAFCMDLLAKKFVLQGDLMVSSNPESAFCYASVIISLWNDFPVFGKLVLAYFYKFCPYLVPYYIPRQVGESDEEFYIKQGYQYKDGQVEKQDKFLKRMTGIMRLYAAILVTKPKKGQQNIPHGIQYGWRWLTSLLKLEPRVDITATMLHTFLETAGFELELKYGRAFFKLNEIIIQKFLPNCRQKCTGGAVTRLDLLLSERQKNRRYKQPNGCVTYAWW